MKKIKYLPKFATSLIFLLFLVANFLLFAGRKSDVLQPAWILATFPDFYQHVANFTISCLLFAAIGYSWLMMGINTKTLLILGLVIIVANFIYELWIPILNTRDWIDALYGCAGTVVGFVFLILMKKFGLRLNPQWKEPTPSSPRKNA